ECQFLDGQRLDGLGARVGIDAAQPVVLLLDTALANREVPRRDRYAPLKVAIDQRQVAHRGRSHNRVEERASGEGDITTQFVDVRALESAVNELRDLILGRLDVILCFDIDRDQVPAGQVQISRFAVRV